MTEIGPRSRHGRRTITAGVLALVAALMILLVLPLASGATRRPNSTLPTAATGVVGTVQKVTSGVTQTAKQVIAPVLHAVASPTATAPGSVAAAPARSGNAARATANPGSETPPMYGTNPHGQGTVASLLLNPSATEPYPYKPGGSGGQILVVGNGRSEQQADGTYDAHTTIAALLGTEILGVNATEGQTNEGPLNSIQTGILNKLCTASSQAVCLQVLAADTAATATGATTHFAVATIGVGGANGLQTKVAGSDSSIQTTGNCETATGSSTAAGIALAGGQVATVGKSSESSTACNDGTAPTQSASSEVIGLGGVGVGIPAAGCANGTPNTKTGLAPLLTIICNADNTTQLATPSGVREALTVIALQLANSALLKTTVVASESHAVAPAKTTPPPACTDSDHDCGKGPPLINSSGQKCNGYPADTVDHDGDCDAGYQSKPSGGKHHVSGSHHHKGSTGGGGNKCTDSDHDCGNGPGLTNAAGQQCIGFPKDTVDNDGDCDAGYQTGNEGPTATVKSSNLPFTGENVLEVILVGLLLAGGGIGLAARTRKRSH